MRRAIDALVLAMLIGLMGACRQPPTDDSGDDTGDTDTGDTEDSDTDTNDSDSDTDTDTGIDTDIGPAGDLIITELVDGDMLGPLDTGSQDRVPRFAQGHGGGGDPAPYWDIPTLAGAGGLRSTAEDLLRFVRANLDPGATPLADAIRASHEVRFEGPDQSIGLGWFVGPDDPGVRWHNGGTGGFHSFAAFDADRGVGVVVLSNTATFAVRKCLKARKNVRAMGSANRAAK